MNRQTRELLATWPFDDTPLANGMTERKLVTGLVEHHGVELTVRDGKLVLLGVGLSDDDQTVLARCETEWLTDDRDDQ
jgi:hypothetical protein